MPCYHPLRALRSSSGVRVLPSDAPIYNLTLPCGQCIGCRLDRSREWAMRCMHESSLHEHNVFITLTYSEEHCPIDGGLYHRHFQLFMKRLRKLFPGVRYYMCGEYGGNFGRPHFHAILFGCNFGDYTLWKRSSSGSNLYRSSTLERLWVFGHSSCGDVTFESCAYVARYIMKKVTGRRSERSYETVDPDTGEIFQRNPEYNRMSLKPGIGAGWYDKFGQTDVYTRDAVILDGTPSSPPRYYDKLFSRDCPDKFISIKAKRMLDGIKRWEDNTPSRLAAKEIVTQATLSKLKRGLT